MTEEPKKEIKAQETAKKPEPKTETEPQSKENTKKEAQTTPKTNNVVEPPPSNVVTPPPASAVPQVQSQEPKSEDNKPPPDPLIPEEDKSTKRNKKIFIVGTVVALLIIAASIGFYFFQNKTQTTSEQVVQITEQSKTDTTQKPVLNKEDWQFEVLNGSGVAGAAGVAAEKLESLGYTVVLVGNADNQNYEKNELIVKEELKDKSDLLVEDIGSEFNITSATEDLNNSTASARLILGTTP
jgi:hypothetical protein